MAHRPGLGRRLGPALIAALVLAAAGPAAAGAQQPSPGTFSISPARRDLVGRPPATLIPTRVSNTTHDPYAVRVSAVRLRQDLSGAFRFSETPRALNAAATILRVTPAAFVLRPGASRVVALRWQLLPRGARAAYVGVIFAGHPQLRGSRAVPVISRLLSVNFLRRPGATHPAGVFSALHATQFAPRVLRLLPRVRNTGDVVAAPRRGRVDVRDAAGHVVVRGRWTGDVILPGAQREFVVDVRRLLPAGRYTAEATMRFGRRRAIRISTPFRLVGPNALPTPGVRVDGFAAQGDTGAPAHVSGRVRSVGSAPVRLDLRVSLLRLTGGRTGPRPLRTGRVRVSALAPGRERALDLDLPGPLVTGQYRVVARYTDPTGAPQELTSDFAARPRRGLAERVRLFLDRRKGTILAVLGGLVLVALVLVLLRRQRRLETELREARARGTGDG